MGVDLQAIRLIDEYTKSRKLGDVLTLGRQGLSLGRSEIKNAAKKYGISNALLESEWCEQLLTEHFGANSVSSLDCSDFEGATLVCDLNEPVNTDVKYDTVIDFGTSEHIFNVKIVYENIKNLCKTNGGIIHLLPANNFCGHGFYQFSPMFFRSVYGEDSGFIIESMYLAKMSKVSGWFRVDNVYKNDRFVFYNNYPTTVMLIAHKKSAENSLAIQQPDYQENWINPGSSGVNKKQNSTLSKFKTFLKANDFNGITNALIYLYKIIYPYHGYSTKLKSSPYALKENKK